jgi:hypothetical protein
MKSYIKIYGPPISEALKALRKVAIDFPEVCVMDTALESALGIDTYNTPGGLTGAGGGGSLDSVDMVMNYFGGPGHISKERCGSIISKSGESVGQFDFYYEWFQKPTVTQLENLIEKIDEALSPVGVKYTITTK